MAKPDFFDSFYTEAMSEMAQNFFTRRKEIETRLEGFATLAAQVRSVSEKVQRRLVTFLALTHDDPLALAFLAKAGGDFIGLVPCTARNQEPWPLKTPFAFTFAGRHEKALQRAYAALQQAVHEYREGSYGPDPKDPRRKVLLPNYRSVRELAETINKEVDTVNTAQTPATVLAYAKSLDPQAAGRESVTGGLIGLDVGKIDRDLAFRPIDFDALGLPDYPNLRPADEMENELEELGRAVRAGHSRAQLERALRRVAPKSA
ncbi:hypothetical protein JCM15519_16420 [Fundidesulfovibrio butyratiphilus]